MRGQVVVPRGVLGIGLVSDANTASSHSKPGMLLLEARYLKLADGRELQVAIDRRESTLKTNAKSLQFPIYGHYLPMFSMAFGTFSYLNHGKDLSYPSGTTFVVYTIEDMAVAINPKLGPTQAFSGPLNSDGSRSSGSSNDPSNAFMPPAR